MRFPAWVIGVAVALLLTVAFWFLLYKPADNEQKLIETEILNLQAQQSDLKSDIALLRDVKRREVEIRAAMARLEEYIPLGPDQPAAIRQFQTIADDAGADIMSVTWGEPVVPQAAAGVAPADTGTPQTTLANIPVTMVIEGGYFQVVDFFRRVEVELPRAVLVNQVDIVEAQAGFPRLSTTWNGQLFSVVDTADLVDVTTGGGTTPTPGATPTPTPSATPSPAGGDS
jgi:Tfp pilus assembly protein PilO